MRALPVIASFVVCSLPSIAEAQLTDRLRPATSVIEHTTAPEILGNTVGEGARPKELFIEEPVVATQEQIFSLPTPNPRKVGRSSALPREDAKLRGLYPAH